MSEGELKYPKWQAEFQEAVLELNREQLFEKIQKFETAIFVRFQSLYTANTPCPICLSPTCCAGIFGTKRT